MFGGIIEEVERIAPSVESLGASSVAGAEVSVSSPSGAELGGNAPFEDEDTATGGKLGASREEDTGEGGWEGVEVSEGGVKLARV